MKDKRITVTGGRGFLGVHLIRRMQGLGYRRIAVADLPEYNLVDMTHVRRLYEETRPDIVIHLAAKVGGIGFNQENPASLFYENAMMGIQLLHEGYAHAIEKFVALGTICAYPKFTPVPFKEDDLWDGYPEETNAPYGLAKKMMLVQSQAYRTQYGFNSIFLLPVNLYGPGDNFDPASSHVIPALIKKCVDAMSERGERDRRLGNRQGHEGVLLRRRCRRGDHPGNGALQQERAGEHRRGLRDIDQGTRRFDRRAHRLRRQGRLGYDQAGRPTPTDARYHNGQG